MHSRSVLKSIACVIAAALTYSAAAQETPRGTNESANEELTYFDLRRSKDRNTQLTAERYFNLAKSQEWTDSTGKYKTVAKYVAHDPDLKWVTLETARGRGAERVVKQVKIPLERLNDACQRRVKQIAFLQPKMDELVIEEKKRRSEENSDSRGGYGSEGDPRGAEMTQERDRQTDQFGEYGSQSAEPGSNEREPGGYVDAANLPDGSEDLDPLGFADLAGELAAAPAGGNPGLIVGSPAPLPPGVESPRGPAASSLAGGPVDRSQWKTNFVAFLANFTASRDDRSGESVNWGELADLRQMNEVVEANLRDNSDPYHTKAIEIADRLGEVQWAAVFEGLGETSEGQQEVHLRLPPLPPPLTLRFLASEREIGPWMGLRPGMPVQFAGRFDIRKPGAILVMVRKLD